MFSHISLHFLSKTNGQAPLKITLKGGFIHAQCSFDPAYIVGENVHKGGRKNRPELLKNSPENGCF